MLLYGRVGAAAARIGLHEELHLLQPPLLQGQPRAELLPQLRHRGVGHRLELEGRRVFLRQLYQRHLKRLRRGRWRLLRLLRLQHCWKLARRVDAGELHGHAGLPGDVRPAGHAQAGERLHEPDPGVVGLDAELRQDLQVHGAHLLQDPPPVLLRAHLLLVGLRLEGLVHVVEHLPNLRDLRCEALVHAVLEGQAPAGDDRCFQRFAVRPVLPGVRGRVPGLLARASVKVPEEALGHALLRPQVLGDVQLHKVVDGEANILAAEFDLHAVLRLREPQEPHERRGQRRRELQATALVIPEDKVRHLLLHLCECSHLGLEACERGPGSEGKAEALVLEFLGEPRVLRVHADEPRALEAAQDGFQLPADRGHGEAAAELEADQAELLRVRPRLHLLEPRVIPVDLHGPPALRKP
mmetsp:Transcript_76082/g.223052  ORF Transcript_76082/g.223052 Transcript_76082/m.223052 type:complete len:411 (-) Transcript_76082:181-1413(-)